MGDRSLSLTLAFAQVATRHVFGLRDRLKVVGIDTNRHLAQMVKD